MSVLIENNTLLGEGGGTGISASGEGTVIRNNSLAGYHTGVGAGPGVEVRDNEIAASSIGIGLGSSGGPMVTDNRLHGGAIVIPTQGSYPAYNFSIGANNTVNGLPVAVHRGCDGLNYNGTALGQLIVITCTNVSLSNLVFRDVSAPLHLVGVVSVSIDNVTVENASLGVWLETVYLGTVASSHFNASGGFKLRDAMNVTLDGNVFESEQVTLSLNTAAGIKLTNNTIRGGAWGALQASTTFELELRGNELTNGGLEFWGSGPQEYASHTIDETNTVDGKPILYLRDLQGARIENRSLGELILVNSKDVTVANVDAASAGPAVVLAWNNGVRLSNVTTRASRTAGLSAVSSQGLEVVDSHLGIHPDVTEYSWRVAAALSETDNVTFLRSELNGTGGWALLLDGGSGVAIFETTIR